MPILQSLRRRFLPVIRIDIQQPELDCIIYFLRCFIYYLYSQLFLSIAVIQAINQTAERKYCTVNFLQSTTPQTYNITLRDLPVFGEVTFHSILSTIGYSIASAPGPMRVYGFRKFYWLLIVPWLIHIALQWSDSCIEYFMMPIPSYPAEFCDVTLWKFLLLQSITMITLILQLQFANEVLRIVILGILYSPHNINYWRHRIAEELDY